MKEKGSLMTTLTSEEIEELERLLPIAWGPIDSQETAESLRTIDALRKIRARIPSLLLSLKQARAEAADLQTRITGLESLLCDAQAEVERVREGAITDAIKRMDEIGRDWKADGQTNKFYATNYLVEAIRPLMKDPTNAR